MQRQVSDVVKVLLVPTTAFRSKRHWYLDAGESGGQMIVWRKAGKVMKWVPLPSTLRESTMRRKVQREVSFLSPALSPPLRKKGKLDTSGNKGCKCSLGSPCKRLRLESAAAGRLPHCEPRLAKFPSSKKVEILFIRNGLFHTYTYAHARTTAHIHGEVRRWYVRGSENRVRRDIHTHTHTHTHTYTHACIYTRRVEKETSKGERRKGVLQKHNAGVLVCLQILLLVYASQQCIGTLSMLLLILRGWAGKRFFCLKMKGRNTV